MSGSDSIPPMNKKDGLFLLAVTILIILLAVISSQGQSFYQELNAFRKAHALPALKVDSTLEIEAARRVMIIYDNNSVLSHGDASDIIGEVIAKNCDLQCWLESPAHRRILLSRRARRIGFYQFNGIACARLQ